jgi:hypothetical protein
MKENMTRRNRTKIVSRKVGLAVPANVKLKLPIVSNPFTMEYIHFKQTSLFSIDESINCE